MLRRWMIVSVLLALGLSSYNTSRAKDMAYVCANTFATEAEINSWTCKYCPSYKMINTKAFNNSITNIFGYTGYSPVDNAIVIAFRSTVNIQNWIVDLDATQVPFPGCADCLVHQGFYNAFSGVQAYVRSEFQKLTALYKGANIFVTGYSLGSALATIAALDIKALFGHVDQFYTFGEPRVGNEAFATFFTGQIPERYRIIHYADIVPHIPPQVPIPYSHFSSQIWYDEPMKVYKQCGAEEFRCSKSLLPNKWSTNDHDFNFYISLPI